mgnify:CR=1 FL=1
MDRKNKRDQFKQAALSITQTLTKGLSIGGAVLLMSGAYYLEQLPSSGALMIGCGTGVVLMSLYAEQLIDEIRAADRKKSLLDKVTPN